MGISIYGVPTGNTKTLPLLCPLNFQVGEFLQPNIWLEWYLTESNLPSLVHFAAMDEELLNANVAVGASTASASSSKKGPAKAKGQESPRSVAHKKLGGFFIRCSYGMLWCQRGFDEVFHHCFGLFWYFCSLWSNFYILYIIFICTNIAQYFRKSAFLSKISFRIF